MHDPLYRDPFLKVVVKLFQALVVLFQYLVLEVLSQSVALVVLSHPAVQAVLSRHMAISHTVCTQVSLATEDCLVRFCESHYFDFSVFSSVETNILEE